MRLIFLFLTASIVLSGCQEPYKIQGNHAKKETTLERKEESSIFLETLFFDVIDHTKDEHSSLVRKVRYRNDGFSQMDSVYKENEFGGLSETSVYFMDDTGLYLEEIMEFTEKNVIEKRTPLKENPVFLYPFQVGTTWKYVNDTGSYVSQVVSINGTFEFKGDLLKKVTKVEEFNAVTNEKRIILIHEKYGELQRQSFDPNGKLVHSVTLIDIEDKE